MLARHKYSFDLSGQIKVGPLCGPEIESLFTDGRVAGILAEHLVCKWFGFKRNEDDTKHYNVESQCGAKFEVRTVTEHGVALLPSSQLGLGRNYNQQQFLDRLCSLTGFIFVDITRSPLVTVWRVDIDDLPLQPKLSNTTAKALCLT